MRGNRWGEKGTTAIGDALSPEMANKLIGLRQQLEASATAKSMKGKPGVVARKEQQSVVVVRKQRKAFVKPNALPSSNRVAAPSTDTPREGTVLQTRGDDHRPQATYNRRTNRMEFLLPDVSERPIVGSIDETAYIYPRHTLDADQKTRAIFDLCLFDLDDTLVRTSDMHDLRHKGVKNQSQEYADSVTREFNSGAHRNIYTPEILSQLQTRFPNVKLGVFTRSPRSYAKAVLTAAYANPWWDVLIAYEDVERKKPSGEGILSAMRKLGVQDPRRVLMVGDSADDIRAAYNAGVIAAADRSSWPTWRRDYVSDNWRTLELLPDMFFDHPVDVLKALESLPRFQPELERIMSGFTDDAEFPRFDKVKKFLPREFGADTRPFDIFACGRLFSNYPSLSTRKSYHALTASIHDNKGSIVFPDEWVRSIYTFIRRRFGHISGLIVTVIPHRPGRVPRLENLLGQLEKFVSSHPFPGSQNISFAPGLLEFREGVRSQSNEKLGRLARFENIRDHLVVRTPSAISGRKSVLVLDDVCTTGSSLIYASKRLSEAGAGDVTRLAISMNISDVFHDRNLIQDPQALDTLDAQGCGPGCPPEGGASAILRGTVHR